VLDINDNSPKFNQSSYTVEVTEIVAIGTDIFVLTATDLDEDKRLFYTIHSATPVQSINKFKINSETGKQTQSN